MSKSSLIKVTLGLCFVSIPVTACNGSREDQGTDSRPSSSVGLLRHVPADTPYVFAMLEPIPEDLADKFEPKLDGILTAYRELMKTMVKTSAKGDDESDDDEAIPKEAVEVIDELTALLSVEGFNSAGIDRDTTMVIYGTGLLPVLRMKVSDGGRLEATIARIEKKAGNGMSVATIGDQSYRYTGDDKARLVIAVIDNELILSLVPTKLPEGQLKSILGLTPPASSLADTGELQKIIDDNGFKPYSLGLVDVARIAATFLDSQSGVNAELLSLMDYDATKLSDVCKSEIRALARIVPRIISGYTEMSAEKLRSNTVIELRQDIAAGLAKLTAPVPGLGREQGGLVAFGMSLDLLAARAFYASRLDAIEAEPYRCELLADLQGGAAKGRDVLNQPIPPIVYGFKGFLAVVEDIKGMDLAKKQPPTSADVRLLVSADNAGGLLAMGAMFSPEIAALDLKPDGKPVKFDAPQMAGVVDAAYVAMTENALAVSIGAGTERRLGTMLTAAIGEPPPFLLMEMDATRYYDFIAEAIAIEGDQEDPSPPELKAAVSKLMRVTGELFLRMIVRVEFTKRGIEIPTTILLAD